MARFIIILVVFVFLYLYPVIIYWYQKMKDPWQFKFIFGKMGVGKTGLIAKLSLKDLQDPTFKRVYTTIGVPGTYKFDFQKAIEGNFTFPPESSIYVDEFGLVYNSRDFKSFPKQARKWMKFLRQSKCKLTVFSQAPDIDKSCRDLCHSYSLLRRIGPVVVEFEVAKNIDVGSDIQGNGQLVDNYFKLGILGGIHLHYLPRYFDLWNSYDPPNWDILQADLIPVSPNLIKAMSFRKFYVKNFKKVYSTLCRRVSATRSALEKRIIKNLLITDIQFKYIQIFWN